MGIFSLYGDVIPPNICTIGYSIGDVETCATDKTALAKSSTYSKSFLASSKVSFGCWGTTKTTRLEIASISVTYDSEDHVVSALTVTPTTKATDSNIALLEADYTVSVTKDGAAGSSADYMVSVGSLSGDTYSKRADVTWGTTKPALGDNCLRFIANYPQTAGGTDYLTADVALTVNRPTLTALTISDATATINKGETKALTVKATPNDADASVTWTSSNSGVATVAADGVVTAVANGEATITATSTTVSSIAATCAVTVITPTVYNLVTSLDQLTTGSKVVIGNGDGTKVMSGTQGSNNRDALTATASNNVVTPSAGYGEFTIGLEVLKNATVYTFKDSNGYLYAASSSSNYMKLEETLDDDGRWTVSLSGGAFSIVANGTNSRNAMRYNSSSTLFSCYSSGQAAVALYILPDQADSASSFANDFIATFLCDGGETAPKAAVWSTLATRYAALTTNDKNSLKNADANASGTDLEKCVARYDYVLSKYGTDNYANFMERTILPQSSFFPGQNSSDSTSALIITLSQAFMAIAGASIIVLKRRKEN